MAGEYYSPGDPRTVTLVNDKTWADVKKECFVFQYAGTDSDSLIHVDNDFHKSKGSEKTFTLRAQMTGRGRGEGQRLEGFEEGLDTSTDKLVLGALKHATRSESEMSDQRVPWSVHENMRLGIVDWISTRLEVSVMNQLAGNTAEADLLYTGLMPTLAPTRQLLPNGVATTQALTATDKFSLKVLDRVIAEIGMTSPTIRPVKTKSGKKCFVCFIDPRQELDLYESATRDSLRAIQLAQIQGGEGEDADLYKNAIAVYRDVIIRVVPENRIPNGLHSVTGALVPNTRKAILCGAQSLLYASTKGRGESAFSWVEKKHDYDDFLGIAVKSMMGMKKAQFPIKVNGVPTPMDFSTIVIPTYTSLA